MNTQDLTAAVRSTLGDHPDSFDISGIVEEIGGTYGYDLNNIDDIPTEEYWQILERHDPRLPNS